MWLNLDRARKHSLWDDTLHCDQEVQARLQAEVIGIFSKPTSPFAQAVPPPCMEELHFQAIEAEVPLGEDLPEARIILSAYVTNRAKTSRICPTIDALNGVLILPASAASSAGAIKYKEWLIARYGQPHRDVQAGDNYVTEWNIIGGPVQ